MADLEPFLRQLDQADAIDSVDLAKTLNVDHQKVVGAIKSIQCIGDVSSTKI